MDGFKWAKIVDNRPLRKVTIMFGVQDNKVLSCLREGETQSWLSWEGIDKWVMVTVFSQTTGERAGRAWNLGLQMNQAGSPNVSSIPLALNKGRRQSVEWRDKC